MKKKTDEVNILNKRFKTASTARGVIDPYRVNHEEFYYNDVDSTKSQFDRLQKANIQATYNIPISTKIAYPIIEQMLSFLTGSKPFPRLVGATDEDGSIAAAYSEGYKGVWYESKSNRELKNALRDMLVVGVGFLKVRTNSFFDESAFNVIHEYIRWKHIYIDPESRKEDLSDAEYIIHAYPMPLSKAEKKFDTKIDIPSTFSSEGYSRYDDDAGGGYSMDNDKDKAIVFIKEFYEKEEKSVYISENGDVALKRPKPIEVPNPKKIALGEEIQGLMGQLQQIEQAQQQTSQQVDQINQIPSQIPGDASLESFNQEQDVRNSNEELSGQMQELQVNLQQLQKAYGQEPDKVPAYLLINERDEKVISFEPIRTTKKRIKRTLMAADTIIEKEYLPVENYPIISFTMQHAGITNKTYGIMHYILDLQKFLNKTYSMLIYDMQISNRPKVFIPEGAVLDKKKWEESFSMPGAMLTYQPNDRLPNGGRPEIIQPSPLSQVTTYVIQEMTKLIEYVTGIHGVVMGDSSSMPNTASATTSLQNFGTQRVKLYARNIEPSLEALASSTIEHLQHYAPKDKLMMYIDERAKPQAFKLFQVKEDLRFKIRVDIVNDLPTVRHQMATMLSAIAGQTKNPYVADAVTKEVIKLLDQPEFIDLADKIDAMKQLEGQNQQLQQQLQDKEGQIKVLTNNQIQKDAAHKIDKAATEAQSDINMQKIQAENELNNNQEVVEPDINGGW
jgi:hypothetical protein